MLLQFVQLGTSIAWGATKLAQIIPQDALDASFEDRFKTLESGVNCSAKRRDEAYGDFVHVREVLLEVDALIDSAWSKVGIKDLSTLRICSDVVKRLKKKLV